MPLNAEDDVKIFLFATVIHRIAITNSRIVSVTEKEVSFWAKDYKSGQTVRDTLISSSVPVHGIILAVRKSIQSP
ncbi:MAG: transposase [Enterocloster clostridioformis]|nr:transposase [Enterocloster clostridioformis]